MLLEPASLAIHMAQPGFMLSDYFCPIYFRNISIRDLPGKFKHGSRTILTHDIGDKKQQNPSL